MKKFIAFVLFVAVAVALPQKQHFSDFLIANIDAVSQLECTAEYTCASSSGACTGEFDGYSGNNCNMTDGTCCPLGTFCVDGTCADNNMGSPCDTYLDCEGSFVGTYIYQCIDSVCVQQFNAGDSCAADSDCFGNMPCNNGTCVGFKEGEQCIDGLLTGHAVIAQSCEFGLVCSFGVCVDTIAAGEMCTFTTSHFCAPGLVCSNNICIEAFSVADGSPCSSASDCLTTSHCNYDTLLCEPGRDITVVECETDDDCPTSVTTGVCDVCSPFTGKSFCTPLFLNATLYAAERKDALDCYVENKCALYSTLAEGSCQNTYCHDQSEAVFGEIYCSSGDDKYFDMCLGEEESSLCSSGGSGWVKWLILGIIIAVAAIIVIVIIVVASTKCSKRDNYNAI